MDFIEFEASEENTDNQPLVLIGQFLDILTDGFKLMMSVTGIVFSLNVFSKEICLGLL